MSARAGIFNITGNCACVCVRGVLVNRSALKMAENVQASDDDDLEEGEIPSSEDEDESKGAEATDKLPESIGQGDLDAARAEGAKESRKRPRDASPEPSAVDASANTPDQPKVRPTPRETFRPTDIHTPPTQTLC